MKYSTLWYSRKLCKNHERLSSSYIQHLFAIKLDTNRTNAFANLFIPMNFSGTRVPRPSSWLHITFKTRNHRYLPWNLFSRYNGPARTFRCNINIIPKKIYWIRTHFPDNTRIIYKYHILLISFLNIGISRE